MKWNIVAAGVALMAASGAAVAATWKTEAELKPFAESVMAKVAANDLAGAFKAMQPYAVAPEAELQSVALQSKAQREQYGARYGKPIGYEFIGQKKVGDTVVRLLFVEKAERHAMPWSFIFYKGPKGWTLNSFNWSDQLGVLFEEK